MKAGTNHLMKDLALHISLLISYLFIIGQLVRFFLRKNASSNFSNSKIQIIAGLLLGFLGIILIYFGIDLNEQVIIDFRYIPIIIAGTFFGFPAAILSSILIAIMRLFVGGINEFSLSSSFFILLIGIVTGFFSRLSFRKESKMLLLTLMSTILIYVTYYVNLTILSDSGKQFAEISQIYWAFSLFGSVFAFYVAKYIFWSIKVFVELENTKIRLSTFISHLNSGVIVETPDRRIEIVNEKFYDLFHIPKKENLVGLHAEKLLIDRYYELVNTKETVLNEEVLLGDGRVIERDFIPITSPNQRSLGHLWNFRDITDRKDDEKRTFGSKENYKRLLEQYQSVIENVKEVIFQTDVMGNWTFLNKSWTEITGYCAEESLGQSFLKFVHSDEQNRLNEWFDSLIHERNDEYKCEVRYVTESGTTKWIEMFARLTFDTQGEIIGTSGTLFDITNRKQMEIKILENEQLYKSLFQHNQSPSYLLDTRGVFTQVNDATELVTGYTRAKLVGTSFAPLISKNFVEDTISYFKRTLNGESLTFETEIKTRDGNKVRLNINISPIIINEKIIGVIGMAYDITKEKVAERKLIESEHRYRSLIDLSPEVIFVHSRHQIEFINHKVVEFIGAKSIDDLIGKTVFDFLHPDDRRTAVFNMALGFKNESLLIKNSELRLIRFDGKVVIANVGATLIEYNGKPAIMGVIHDITEKKEIERQLVEANEMLHEISKLDGLTGIPNRRSYDEKLQQEWELALSNNQSISLLMIDIDYFKLYNDAYGHQQGDNCLQEVAKSLQQEIEQSGQFVARYGGEEFSVILRDRDEKSTFQVAETLRSNIEALNIPHVHSSIGPFLTISIGMASFRPTSDVSIHDLMKYADLALYETKRNGRNTIHTN
ncbi:PAS domain S-box protein [Paenisporosarcina sp. OV554]|uniref:PAS domain S-box protein n=1 Tax=Paenisporosarcina sp. OV554 TaxID=2135694 RepID=UPI0013049081|nr:PAS domain S-box protein [Paenisporosarcina sp. OV554]